MGQHKIAKLRTCLDCGAQETTDAAGMAAHLCAKKDAAWMRRRRRGKCTRCGKACLPYVMCAEHRFASRVYYALRRGVQHGLFVQPRRGHFMLGDPDVKIRSHKTNWDGRAPRGFFTYARARLEQEGKPMHEDALIAAFTEYRRDRAARGHLESRHRAASPSGSSAIPTPPTPAAPEEDAP